MKNKIFIDIRRQVSAKKNTAGSIIITILLIVAFFSTFLIFIPEQVSAASYSDFSNSKELTIESDLIDATLTNFPLLVHDNTGDLLGNVLANGSDIAFFNTSKATQFNHEIEEYNSTTGELIAWVNVTTISDSVDTVFYMYYNDSDGGYPVGYNPESVWDANYVGVYHFNESTGNRIDSTNHNNDITPGGDPTRTESKIGYGVAFDGDDYFVYDGVYGNGTLDHSENISVELWVQTTAAAHSFAILRSYVDVTTYIFYGTAGNLFFFNVWNGTAATQSLSVNQYVQNAYNYIASTYNNVTYNNTMYFNGTHENTTNVPDGVSLAGGDEGTDPETNFFRYRKGTPDSFLTGDVDELRISNITRNASWINASFHSQNETAGFLTFGAQQDEGSSSYSIQGLTSDRITFDGVAGTTVWCNSSGDGNEWLEVNMSINATVNISEIRGWMGDLNNSGSTSWINVSNITMYVSSDNSSYGEMGTFTDGGSNCSNAINATNWNAGTMGADPFAGAGLTNKTTSIFLIFKLTIPATAPTDVFWSAASDSFKIYIGYS